MSKFKVGWNTFAVSLPNRTLKWHLNNISQLSIGLFGVVDNFFDSANVVGYYLGDGEFNITSATNWKEIKYHTNINTGQFLPVNQPIWVYLTKAPGDSYVQNNISLESINFENGLFEGDLVVKKKLSVGFDNVTNHTLYVDGVSCFKPSIVIQSSLGEAGGYMYIQRNDDGHSYVLNETPSGGDLRLGAGNNLSQLVLKSDGKVAIGKTSTSHTLDVNGSVNVSNITVDDLNNDNSLVFTNASGKLENNANLTFDGSTLALIGNANLLDTYTNSIRVGDLNKANSLVFTNASGKLENNANLTFDGSNLHVKGSAGRLGIGPNNPQFELDISGDINFTGNLLKGGNLLGSVGGGGSGFWSATFSDIYFDTGNLGIGTSNPQALLDVSGTDAIILPRGTTGQRPGLSSSTDIKGMIRYNTTLNQFEGYGSAWGSLGGVKTPYGHTKITADDTNGLQFFTSNNQKMVINSSGDVGIGDGATNPQSLLHLYKITDDIVISDISYSNVLRLTSQYQSDIHKRGPLITFTNQIIQNYGYGGEDSVTGTWTNNSNDYSEYLIGAIGSHQRGVDNWNGSLSFYTKPVGRTSTLQERMTITHEGNVGIGINNPVEKLDINGVLNLRAGTVQSEDHESENSTVENYKSNTYIRFDEAGSTNDWAYLRQIGTSNNIHLSLDFHDDGINDGRFSIRYVDSYNDGTHPTDESAVTIFTTKNGNVGIGTDIPTAKLDVSGSANIVNNAVGQNALIVDGSANITGRVGIGISNPKSALTVSGLKLGTPQQAGIHLGLDTLNGSGSTDNAGIEICTEGAGIGYIDFNSTTTGSSDYNGRISYNNDTTNMNFKAVGDYIFNNGNVGIGTDNPSAKLDVSGSANIVNNAVGQNALIVDGSANIKGNVGIGADNPQALLDVSGTGAIILPRGTNAERPADISGMLRYNTDSNEFEGYNGTWEAIGGGGGGVLMDNDNDTKITTALSDTNQDNKLRFFTNGEKRMIIDDDSITFNNKLVNKNNDTIYEITNLDKETILYSGRQEDNASFGYQVAIFEKYAIVIEIQGYTGTETSHSTQGHIYEEDENGNWNLKNIVRGSDTDWDQNIDYVNGIGKTSIAINNDYAFIGGYGANSDKGAVYIFKRNIDNTWGNIASSTTLYKIETQKLLATGGTNDRFAYSLAASNNYLIVGAFNNSGNYKGAAYIFELSSGTWTQKHKLVVTGGGTNYDYFGISVGITDNYAIVGAFENHTYSDGSAYIFERSSDNNWGVAAATGTDRNETLKLVASDASAQDKFGYAVAISGNYAVIAAPEADVDGIVNTGAAYVFERNSSGNWNQTAKLVASDRVANDYFGTNFGSIFAGIRLPCISIDGDLVIISVFPSWSGSRSTAFIYKRDSDGNWGTSVSGQTYSSETMKYPYTGDSLGWSVGVSNSNFILSQYSYNRYRGRVYISKFFSTATTLTCDVIDVETIKTNNITGENDYVIYKKTSYMQDFSQKEKIIASDAAANLRFGYSIGIDGDYAIVGTPGKAYIFERGSDGNWLEKNILLPSVTAGNFGTCVAISGNYAIVGAYGYDQGSTYNIGAVFIFERGNDGNWGVASTSGTTRNETVMLLENTPVASEQFGFSLAISGNYLIVGNIGSLTTTGSAYIFERGSSGTWTQTQTLLASDSVAGDYFGRAVAISGNYAILGAYGNDDSGPNSGSAYIFELSSGTWTQKNKLLASDSASEDQFGFSVAIDGNYAIIGSKNDDDNGSVSGSAYIFERGSDGNWGVAAASGTDRNETSKLLASNGSTGDYFGQTVAISGNYAIIGAPDHDVVISGSTKWNLGSVYIFERDSLTGYWGTKLTGQTRTETKIIVSNDGAAQDEFGWSVAISGNYAIVGTKDHQNIVGGAYLNNSGAAYIFENALSDQHFLTSDNLVVNKLNTETTIQIGTGANDYKSKIYIGGGATNQKKTAIISEPVGPWCKSNLHFCLNSDNDLENASDIDSKLTILNNGNVGIGTDSPDKKLHIKENSADALLKIESTGSASLFLGGHASWGNITSSTHLSLKAGDTTSNGETYNNNPQLFLDSNGNVGIGTTSPGYPLHIGSFASTITDLTARYYNASTAAEVTMSGVNAGNANFTGSTTQSRNLSARFEYHIACQELQVFSDMRIKENIRDVPDNLSLQKLRDISAVYYEYKDKISSGFDSTIGFIAQQVKQHMPMAVTLLKKIIPNEMRNIENPQWTTLTDSSGNNTFKLTISDLSDNSGNTLYRFYVSNDLSGNDECKKEIKSLTDEPKSFIFHQSWNNVFIYGKEVDDFHILDKQKLFALNFSATQEIDRIQQAEKTKLEEAENKIAALENKNAALETQIADILSRLSSLENSS